MDLPEFLDVQLSTRVLFGPGLATSQLGHELAALGRSRPIVVGDPALATLGILDKIDSALQDSGIAPAVRWTDVPADSEVAVVESAARAAREAEADCVVAIGGGSAIDTAKAVAVLLAQGCSVADLEGVHVIEPPVAPLVALPSTAGTGSEVTQYAVIRDAAATRKIHLVSPLLRPCLALLDPELTLSLPPGPTAASGVDALTHAVEAVLSLQASAFSCGLGLEAIREVVHWLPATISDGQDIEARGHMLLAAWTAGAAFSASGVGIVHAMAHALGARERVPHGTANGLFLAAGVRYNHAVVPDRVERVGCALGLAPSLAGDLDAVTDRLDQFVSSVGLPTRLRDVGVSSDALPALAQDALVDGALLFNPRPADEDDLLALLESVY